MVSPDPSDGADRTSSSPITSTYTLPLLSVPTTNITRTPSTCESHTNPGLSTNPLALPTQDDQVTHTSTITENDPLLPNPSNSPSLHQRNTTTYTTSPITVTAAPTQTIAIPTSSLSRRDPNRVPTPLSGRGDRKGHCFPYSRTPSPHAPSSTRPTSDLSLSFKDFDAYPRGWSRARRSSSSSSRSTHMFSKMHAGQRYVPTSPLSPKLSSSSRPLSPQASNKPRPTHTRQTSRPLHMPLPRYSPSNFVSQEAVVSPSSTMQSPAVSISRANQPQYNESLRTMREKSQKMIADHLQASREAASPMGMKPDAPRLDPLGSPKGNVTPLELEGASDYFAVRGAGKRSPAGSPGPHADRSMGREEDDMVQTKRQVDVYQ